MESTTTLTLKLSDKINVSVIEDGRQAYRILPAIATGSRYRAWVPRGGNNPVSVFDALNILQGINVNVLNRHIAFDDTVIAAGEATVSVVRPDGIWDYSQVECIKHDAVAVAPDAKAKMLLHQAIGLVMDMLPEISQATIACDNGVTIVIDCENDTTEADDEDDEFEEAEA